MNNTYSEQYTSPFQYELLGFQHLYVNARFRMKAFEYYYVQNKHKTHTHTHTQDKTRQDIYILMGMSLVTLCIRFWSISRNGFLLMLA